MMREADLALAKSVHSASAKVIRQAHENEMSIADGLLRQRLVPRSDELKSLTEI
jgi:hypothetical protein